MRKNKIGLLALIALAVLFFSCESTDNLVDNDPAVGRGISAWNNRGPSAATAYWDEIADASKKKKWLNYVTLYEAGVQALDSTDSIKASNEAKLLQATNTAVNKFSALDSMLQLPADVKEKGATISAARIDKLLASERLSEAKKLNKSAVAIYGLNDALTQAGKEIEIVDTIVSKKKALQEQAKKAGEKETFDEKVAAYDAVIAKYPTVESEVNSLVKQSTVAESDGVVASVKSFKKVRQDIVILRSGVFRDEAYAYMDRLGEEFARQPDEGSGTGKNGAFTVYDTRNHYQSIAKNMEDIFSQLEAFAAKYPKDVSPDMVAEAKSFKDDLNSKIAQINKEIAIKEEIESRGKTVMPLMIGLFNADPKSSASGKKSRPAKFSATKQSKNEYWWGMVSIPKGTMNDLVITLKDNRTLRVFNQNTHSGKDIEKKNLQDLVSKQNKVGNSWPVLNAGAQLTSDKYFFEIQKGKTDNYSGEVVVYNSFVVRSR